MGNTSIARLGGSFILVEGSLQFVKISHLDFARTKSILQSCSAVRFSNRFIGTQEILVERGRCQLSTRNTSRVWGILVGCGKYQQSVGNTSRVWEVLVERGKYQLSVGNTRRAWEILVQLDEVGPLFWWRKVCNFIKISHLDFARTKSVLVLQCCAVQQQIYRNVGNTSRAWEILVERDKYQQGVGNTSIVWKILVECGKCQYSVGNTSRAWEIPVVRGKYQLSMRNTSRAWEILVERGKYQQSVGNTCRAWEIIASRGKYQSSAGNMLINLVYSTLLYFILQLYKL